MNGSDARRRGRPLIFLLLLLAGWTGMRVAVLSFWPQTSEQTPPASFLVAVVENPPSPSPAGGSVVDEAAPALLHTSPAATMLVEGLEAAPPAHLEVPPVSTSQAAAHNALWMAASGFEMGQSDTGPVAKAPPDIPQ